MDTDPLGSLAALGQHRELAIWGLHRRVADGLALFFDALPRTNAYVREPEHAFHVVLDRWTARALIENLPDDPDSDVAGLREDLVRWLDLVGDE